MNAVLDFLRQRDPRFNEVSDQELTQFAGENHPEFLQDPAFKQDYENLQAGPRLRQQLAMPPIIPENFGVMAAAEADRLPRPEEPIRERTTMGEFIPALFERSPEETDIAARLERGQATVPDTESLRRGQELTRQYDALKQMALDSGRHDTYQRLDADWRSQMIDLGIRPIELDPGVHLPKMTAAQVKTLAPGIPERGARAIAAGQQAVAGVAESFATPEGAALLAGPAAVAKPLASAFIGVMAKDATELTGQALGHYSAGDTEAGDRALIEATALAAMIGVPLVKAKGKDAAVELARELDKLEVQSRVTPDEAAQIRLGLPPRAQPEMLPELARTQELMNQAVTEATQNIQVPGQVPAIELLKRQQVELTPGEPTALVERPGGGEAVGGKVSFMRPAGAPTAERTQAAIVAENVRIGNTETAKALAAGEKGPDALQKQTATEGVLRQERPEVGLPKVAPRELQGQPAAEAAPATAPQEVVSPAKEQGTAPAPPAATAPKTVSGEQAPVSPAKEPSALDRANDWAEKVIAEQGKGKAGSGPDPSQYPRLLAAFAIKGAVLIRNGAVQFKDWSARMIQEFGDAVKPHLDALWAQSNELAKRGQQFDVEGQSVEMRKSAERATTSPMIPQPVQQTVKTAPESFYVQQSMKRVEDTVAGLSDAELGAVTPDSNLYTAAKLEQARRQFEAGNNDAGYAIFVELEKQGTRFGQIINQFKLLKGTRPENVVLAINKKLQQAGRDPLTKESERKALEIARDSKAKDAELDKATDEWRKNPSDANAKLAEDALAESNRAALELQRFVNKFQPRSTPGILKSILQGNLLTPISQVANIVGNISFLPFRAGARGIGAGLDIVDNFIRRKGREIGVHPVSGTREALKGAVRGAKTIPDILRRGTGDVVQGETRAGLHPLRAWVNQFARNPEAPLKGGRLTLGDRLNLLIEGTFGVPAEIMLRGLGSGDAPFREAARSRVITEQLLLQKVPRNQWAMAQKFPELFFDRATMERISSESLAAVFQRESATLKHITNWIRGKGEWVDLALATLAPYKLTPWNIIGEILSYNPLIAMAKTGIEAKRGNTRQAKINSAKFIIGSLLTGSAVWLYENGLLAPSMDERDEAQKARLLAGEVLPPNHLNLTALERALKGGDPSFKPGDRTVDVFRAGGLAGAMFYMTANIGREFERKPAVGDDEMWKAIITQSTLEQARFGLNQSFLSGIEGFLTAVKDGTGEKFLHQYANTVSSIPLPNTLSAISRTARDYKPDLRNDELLGKFETVLKNRLGFTGLDKDLPLKRDLWGKPIPETPEGRTPLVYQFFDITKSKQTTDDPVALELYRIWRKTANTEAIPSLPARSVTYGRQTFNLNPAQYSRFAELIGRERRAIVDRMVLNPYYHQKDDQGRLERLKYAYDEGMERGKELFRKETTGTLVPKQPRAGF